jgi:putative DNA primase/helicase
MLAGGIKANTGQLVRLISIPADYQFGIFNNLHGFNDGRELADHLKSCCQKYYGQLGPAFVKKLIEEKNDLFAQFEKIEKMFVPIAKSNLEKRAASFFAVIALAGELAINYELIAWAKDSVINATLTAYKRWQQSQSGRHTEDSRILDSVRNFIIKHGDSRFSKHGGSFAIDDRAIINRAGWYKDTHDKRVFMLTQEAIQEAGGGYDKNRIIAALSKHHWIVERDSDRQAKKTRTPQGYDYLYYLAIPEEEENQ